MCVCVCLSAILEVSVSDQKFYLVWAASSPGATTKTPILCQARLFPNPVMILPCTACVLSQ